MDILLLGITIVSLVVAFVMSVAAWRLMRDDKKRAAARVAALSVAASSEPALDRPKEITVQETPIVKAPWGRASFDSAAVAYATPAPLRTPAPIIPPAEPTVSHASGFLGAEDIQRDGGGRQKSLAFAAVFLFVVLSGGLVWMMSGPRGTSPVAVGPNSPLELVSLTHARQNQKLAVSGLVRNPASGKPIEHLSAVVFLFDRMGTFITSSRANVDFLKLGAGDESPFVVSLDAPASVARYRVSFRTDDGIVPHIDRRGSVAPAETVGIQQSTVKSSVGSQQ